MGAAVTAHIIDGKAVAAALRDAVAGRVATLGFRPGLTVVLVGDDPASAVYVRNKDRAANAAGLAATTIRLPADTDEPTLLALLADLNADPAVDGILVQMPLPAQIRTRAVIDAIDPAKDVDGLTPTNAGALADGRPGLVPCTPRGVMKLLDAAGITLRGTRAVVLGRSALVGRPVAALLLAADATVTIAHSPHHRHRRGMPPRRGAGGRGRPGGDGARRLDRAGSDGDRCRHQSYCIRHAGGRCRLHRSRRPCWRHHPGSGRGGADDHCLPAGQHGDGGGCATRRLIYSTPHHHDAIHAKTGIATRPGQLSRAANATKRDGDRSQCERR